MKHEKLEEAIRRASELRSRGIDVELVRITTGAHAGRLPGLMQKHGKTACW